MQLKRNKMLRSRKNQILLAFSFWGDIKQRPGNSIYELRSYVLKVGSLSLRSTLGSSKSPETCRLFCVG